MLNWLARYAPAAAHLVGDRGRARGSILDVGCGPHGLACARPDIRFVGLDVEFGAPVAPSMTAVRAAPGPLPFADASFHTVLSLDTLEHIPRPDRPGFVAELARVAACKVLLACPSSDAAGLDEAVRARYAAAGEEAPGWLAEHGLYRLPEPAEIEELARAVPGFRARPWPMVNGVLSSAVTLADLFELHNDTAREAEELRDEWVELLSGATFGPSLRAGWVLERDEPRTATVPEGAAASGLPAALRCPRCGGSFEWAGDTLACTGCGSVSTRDAAGAWVLPDRIGPVAAGAATPAAPGPGARPARLVLAPADWGRVDTWLGPLAAYVAAADPGQGNGLWLDARGSGLSVETIAALVTMACATVAGPLPFGDVDLLAPDDRDPDATPVGTAEEVRQALGAPAPSVPAEPGEIVARARWAKELADALQARVDRDRFEAAPDPFRDPRPTVAVRIATWNHGPMLLERTLPSVLRGGYPNVEVIVCSDGPDPETRAEIEAIGDARLRYEELAERPVYATHPVSFWETAGTRAVNHALDVAGARWIAPLDHDDEFTDDHVGLLLGAAREHQRDLVYGQALAERRGLPPFVVGSAPLRHGSIAHGTVLYSPRLAHMRYDEHAWLLGEPGDWNMWRRVSATGAGVGHVDRVVLLHTVERTMLEEEVENPDVLPDRSDSDLAHDVLTTSARRLLDVAPRA